MGIEAVREKRTALMERCAFQGVVDACSILLRMPSQIGASLATGLRPLDVSEEADRNVLRRECEEELQCVLRRSHHRHHEEIRTIFEEAWRLRIT